MSSLMGDLFGLGGGQKRVKLTPTPVSSPRPTTVDTVMAAKRAEEDWLMRKKRRRATVMGGDYGALNVQTEKLGT